MTLQKKLDATIEKENEISTKILNLCNESEFNVELFKEYILLQDELNCEIMILKQDINDKERTEYIKALSIEIEGDIIITDPCYLMKEDNDWSEILDYAHYSTCDENEILKFNEGFRKITKIKNFITSDTLYGDWSCSVLNTDTNKVIGDFCADAGRVGVFLLDEVLKYNPNFDYHKKRKWTTALIEDFKGIITFDINETPYKYTDSSGEMYQGVERNVIIKGQGNINFIAGMLDIGEE